MILWPLVALGCAHERAPAPAELSELLARTYRTYDVVAERTDTAGLLSDWLVDEGDLEPAWDGLRVANLQEGDVVGVLLADTVLADHRGVATAFQSAFAATDHAELAARSDQRWTDPATFEVYEREVLSGDSGAFAAGTSSLSTLNTIEKSGPFGIRIPYTLRKDYHWAPTVTGGMALMSRWWLTEAGCSDNGKNCVLQSFGLEVYAPRPEGAQRLLVNWIEVTTEADAWLSEDARIGLIAKGNQDLLEATEIELSGGDR